MTLTLIAAAHSAGSTVTDAASGQTTPALLTRTSISPNSSSVARTAWAMSSGSPTSALVTSARPPRSRTPFATSSSSPRERARSATRAPSAASPSTIARPMPRPAPVTIATLFSKVCGFSPIMPTRPTRRESRLALSGSCNRGGCRSTGRFDRRRGSPSLVSAGRLCHSALISARSMP